MLRVTKLAVCAAALLCLWAFLLSSDISAGAHQLVLWSPALAILAFGAFLLVWLIYGVATFKTVPEEAASLQLDIARAKQEFAKRGITTILPSASARRQLTLVDFSVAWCGPCRMLAPVLAQLAREHLGRLVVVKVDCEVTPANRALAAEASISAFPTLHLYNHESQRVAVMRGADAAALRRAVSQQLALLPTPLAPGAMANDLAKALGRVRSGCSYDDFIVAVRTLLAYVSNVLDHPEVPKYRRIKVNNTSFQAKIASKPGGRQCMEALGFKERTEAMEEILVIDAIDLQLRTTKSLLEQALTSSSAPGAHAAPAPGTEAPSSAATATAAPASGAGGGIGAAELARTLAQAMSNVQQPGAAQAAPQRRQRQIAMTPAMLARILEKILVSSGVGQQAPQGGDP